MTTTHTIPTGGSAPMPFPVTDDERRANQASHRFFYTGGPDDADVRCDNCDCRPSYVSADWPCGADVPRVAR